MSCSICNREVPIENEDTQTCATCNKASREDKAIYPSARQGFLEMCVRNNVVDPIDETPITMESDIHHKMGRVGYADDWARENGISLLIDVRHFLACNRAGHQWIEAAENRKKALELGYIISRQGVTDVVSKSN